jgi:hypothetical protein
MTLARVSTTFLYTLCNTYIFRAEYRSAIFTHSDNQENIAKQITKEIKAKHFAPKG